MVNNLNNNWKLYFFEQSEHNIIFPSQLSKLGCSCIECSVPGNVELDLSKAGYLPSDLFYGKNILQTEKYETYEWWYTTSFTAKKNV